MLATVTKIHQRSNLKEKGLILAKGMRGCSSLWQGRHGDRSRYQGLEITGYIATAVREMKARPEEGPTYNSQSLLPRLHLKAQPSGEPVFKHVGLLGPFHS